MNAYELADAIEDWDSDGQWDTPAANMLRQQADRIAELEKDLHMIQRHYDQLDTQTNNKNRSWSDICDEATAVWDSLDTSNQSNIECARAWFLEGYHQALTRGQE